MPGYRVIYFGTADFAVPALRELSKRPDSFEIVGVVTQPDRPGRRGMKLQPSPVKALATELGLPVLQPEKAKSPDFLNQVRELAPDAGVVAAYGQILKQELLDIPKSGCVNIHGSILPKYRGAAPIQWALWDGEAESGVTLIRMDAGLDTGDMFAWSQTPISDLDTAQTLHDRLADQGAELLVNHLSGFIEGKSEFRPQDNSLSTYARKITKEDSLLDWSRTARELDLQIRALTPWPGTETKAWVGSRSGGDFSQKRIKILTASEMPQTEYKSKILPGRIDSAALSKKKLWVGCGAGTILQIHQLQLEGKRAMDTSAFLSGYHLIPDHTLGETNTSFQ